MRHRRNSTLTTPHPYLPNWQTFVRLLDSDHTTLGLVSICRLTSTSECHCLRSKIRVRYNLLCERLYYGTVALTGACRCRSYLYKRQTQTPICSPAGLAMAIRWEIAQGPTGMSRYQHGCSPNNPAATHNSLAYRGTAIPDACGCKCLRLMLV
jgi:hypothetical protein